MRPAIDWSCNARVWAVAHGSGPRIQLYGWCLLRCSDSGTVFRFVGGLVPTVFRCLEVSVLGGLGSSGLHAC
jgi:hypothetical protein